MYRVLDYITDFPVWPRKSFTHEFDVETMAKIMYPQIKGKANKKWLDHIFNETGCKERAIMGVILP